MKSDTASKPKPDYGPDGLTRQDRAIIREAIAHYPEIQHTTLFGSRAMGTFGRGSDIDLALQGQKITQTTLAKLAGDLEESNLPYKVDLLVRNNALDEKLEKHIRRYGKPFEWESQRLESLCEAVVDCPHSTPTWTMTGQLVLRSQNIRNGRLDLTKKSFTDEAHYQDRSRRAELREGDLVITREAPMGEVCVIPAGLRCCLGQRMVLLRPDQRRCDGRFLLYALQSPAVQTQIGWSEGTGSTVSNLRIPHLKSLEIQVPPLPDQRAIAAVLGALDDKIEQNRRTSGVLEQLARAIFRAWFVDFAPVHAKAAGATVRGFPSMPQDVFDALPTTFEDSELGPIPKGWEVKPLDTVAEFLNGLALQKYPPNGGDTDLPVIKIAQLRKGSTEGASMANDSMDEKYKVHDRDLLFSWSGTLEVVFWFGGPGALNQHLFKVTSDDYPAWLLYGWVHQHLPEFRLIASSKATTMGHIKRTHLNEALVAVPGSELIQAGNDAIKPLFDLNASLQIESRKLAELRDYLLPKLLSGAVRVNDAERIAEEVV